MSAVSGTVWTCDRCMTQDERSLNDQPQNWVRVYLVEPCKATVEPDHMWRDPTDLCRHCRDSLIHWLHAPRAESAS